MRWTRIAIPAGLVAVALLAWRTVAVAEDSPTAVLDTLERAYSERDVALYETLLSETFEFRSACTESRDRKTELTTLESVFSSAFAVEFDVLSAVSAGLDSTTLEVRFDGLILFARDDGYRVSAYHTLTLGQGDDGEWLIEVWSEDVLGGSDNCSGREWGPLLAALAARPSVIEDSSWGQFKKTYIGPAAP